MRITKENYGLLIPLFQGYAFALMGAYFWYDAEMSFHVAGPGPVVLIAGLIEIVWSLAMISEPKSDRQRRPWLYQGEKK